MTAVACYQATAPDQPLTKGTLDRRELRADDVMIEIEFAGICHSDIHTVRDEWGGCRYPMTPGHEIVGRISELGSAVTDFALGDRVGVGCLVDSCGECAMCMQGLEQCCHEFPLLTYGGTDAEGRTTEGGYSREYVLRESFAYPLPPSLEPSAAAPLMCAGITAWSPLRAAGVGPGNRVAVAGLGGLGHLAVKLAAAFGRSLIHN